MLPEVRMARVLDAIASHRAGRLTCVEAGELLGFRSRHIRRLRDAFEERGENGLIDRRRGRVSARAADEADAAWVADMFRPRYVDFRIKLLHEQIMGTPLASGNAQSIQWGLRSRSRAASGWDHAHAKLEVSGPDGGAVQLQTEVTVIDARLLTPDQRHAFKQALLEAKQQDATAA